MPVAAVNGARLQFERHGSGEPLLFITGFAISAAVFEPVLGRYADRFGCIVFDNRAAGRMRAPRPPVSMPGLAAHAAGLLDALGVESAHVLGVSMGGMVAQELALRFPERVRGLVLGGTSPGGPRAARPALGDLAVLRRDGLAGALFSPRFRAEHPGEVRGLLEPFARHRPPPDGVLAHRSASVPHDTTARLGRIQAPTLVMHSERDTLAPVANARLRPFGLPVGMARTGGSLAAMVGGRLMTRDRRRGAPCGG